MQRYEVIKTNVLFAIAYAVPKWLVYFCTIRLIAHATTGKYSSTNVSELKVMDALERWGK
jgi:hypothetical protein